MCATREDVGVNNLCGEAHATEVEPATPVVGPANATAILGMVSKKQTTSVEFMGYRKNFAIVILFWCDGMCSTRI
jgi:hypothetical protein